LTEVNKFDIFVVCQNSVLACLHRQNRSGFFERPAFIQPIRAI